MELWISDGLVSNEAMMQQAKQQEESGGWHPEAHRFMDWSDRDPKVCSGCWSCWWKTPGRCVHHDLDDFYRAYVNAERVTFFLTASKGFVCSRFKTVMDRMIPLFLPYTAYHSGESMHVKRYDRYPDILIHYGGDLRDAKEEAVFTEYLHRCFYQFHSTRIDIRRYAA